MAGDWIKMEQATGEKPEVLTIARMLGVSRREAIGILFDYWSWLDRNARHALVRNLSRQCLDDVLHCPGFAACLEHVGWIEWDDDASTATIVNYDRHNGSSAKTRASDQKRKRVERSQDAGQNPDEIRTREEKRRDIREREITAPTEQHYEIGRQHGQDVDAQWVQYLDWNKNAKNRHKDLRAGFSNWLRRANEFRPAARSGKQDARANTAAQIFGVPNERSSERVIDGEAERVA